MWEEESIDSSSFLAVEKSVEKMYIKSSGYCIIDPSYHGNMNWLMSQFKMHKCIVIMIRYEGRENGHFGREVREKNALNNVFL